MNVWGFYIPGEIVSNGHDVNTLDKIHWANQNVMWWVAFRKLRSQIHGLLSISPLGNPDFDGRLLRADYQQIFVIIISWGLTADITEGYAPTMPVYLLHLAKIGSTTRTRLDPRCTLDLAQLPRKLWTVDS